MSLGDVRGATVSVTDREFAENHIREVTDPGERRCLLALAEPLLEWRSTPGSSHFPYLSLEPVRARGWVTGIKIWVDAFGRDEEAWCRAMALASSAKELVGVVPDRDPAQVLIYRLPMAPRALNRFLSPFSLSATLLFPEDLGFVLYKDDGETLVAAGPPAFVQTVLPEGPEAAEAQYRACAAEERHEVTRRLMLEMADWCGGAVRE